MLIHSMRGNPTPGSRVHRKNNRGFMGHLSFKEEFKKNFLTFYSIAAVQVKVAKNKSGNEY